MEPGTPVNKPNDPSEMDDKGKPKLPPAGPADSLGGIMRDTFNNLVREQVVHRLGKPGDLLGVYVRPLWGDYYRVNVVTGTHVAASRISDSFFLVVDGDGKIVKSTPKIARLY